MEQRRPVAVHHRLSRRGLNGQTCGHADAGGCQPRKTELDSHECHLSPAELLSRDLLAGVRRPLAAVRLLLELRTDEEWSIQVLGIDDFRYHGEPILARRILERHEVLDQACPRAVGYAVTPEPAG